MASNGEPWRCERQNAMHVLEEAVRREPVLIKLAAAALQIDELIGAQRFMKRSDFFANARKIAFFDPDTIALPVDLILEWKNAVGVDENRNAAEAERFIKSYRPVRIAARAEHIIAIQRVLHHLTLLPARG